MALFAHNVFPIFWYLLCFQEHFHKKNMNFDHSAAFSPLEVKFLHLENHSHYQRGSSHASNLHKHMRAPEWKNPAVMQGAIEIKKERSAEHVGSRKAQFFEKHGFQKMPWGGICGTICSAFGFNTTAGCLYSCIMWMRYNLPLSTMNLFTHGEWHQWKSAIQSCCQIMRASLAASYWEMDKLFG